MAGPTHLRGQPGAVPTWAGIRPPVRRGAFGRCGGTGRPSPPPTPSFGSRCGGNASNSAANATWARAFCSAVSPNAGKLSVGLVCQGG